MDNKQTGGNDPSNKPNVPNLWDWLATALGIPVWAVKLIFALIVLLVGLPIVFSILGIFFPIFRDILRGIWAVITSPFRLIAWIIRKVKGD